MDGSAASGAAVDGATEDRLSATLACWSGWTTCWSGRGLVPGTAGPLESGWPGPSTEPWTAVALRLAGLMHTLTVEEIQTAGRRLRLSSAMVSLLSAVSMHPSVGADLLPRRRP